MAFQLHDIVWTPEAVNRFWDHYAQAGSSYFSEEVGDSLIRFARRKLGGFPGRTLDYGCGPGRLLKKLTARGIDCEGAETSSESLGEARRRVGNSRHLKGLTQLRGLPSPLADDAYETVFFVETIEHVLPETLPATVFELLRITKPGGHVIVTTPNEEDMERRMLTCPECGCRYHRMQHVRAWTATSLAGVMEAGGWETVSSEPTRLPLNNWASRLRTRLRLWRGCPKPHLVYIGRKPDRALAASALRRVA